MPAPPSAQSPSNQDATLTPEKDRAGTSGVCSGSVRETIKLEKTTMNFERQDKKKNMAGSLPPELYGFWLLGSNRYEIRADDRYYVHDLDVPYGLIDAGMTLIHSGTRFNRLFGDPAALPGVWLLEGNPTEEWNLRTDGSYTYHWPGFEYFGEYSSTGATMTTAEMRAVLTEAGGVLTFDPPYAVSISAPWSLTEPYLTIDFPSGTQVFTRE